MSILLFMSGIGVKEIILILVIVMLLFGGKKIPELMRGIGQGIKEFKNAKSGEEKINPEKKDNGHI